MKNQLFLVLFLIISKILTAQQKSDITDVTVYLDGAEINRTATINIKSGTTEFIFNGLSPHIDESSIQISGLKNASVLSINYGINYLSKLKQSDSITILQDKIKALDAKIESEYELIAGYNEEVNLIQSNKKLSNETEVVSLEQLKNFAKYYRTRITELKKAINTSNSTITKHKKKQIDIQNQLIEFNVEEKQQTGEIKIKLSSDVSNTLDLNISYNITHAGWFPIYDLKADKINIPLNLEYKAHVYQNSGCDWDDVNLVLSTSDPNTNNVKPVINPKYLNFINRYSNYNSQRATKSYNYKYNPLVKTVSGVVTSTTDGLPLPGVNILEKGTSNGTQTDYDGKYSLQTTSGNTLVYSYVGMQTEELPIHSSIMNVNLNEDNQALDEVVVVGYRSKNKEYNRAKKALEGEVPGVNIQSSNGFYNSNSEIRIRGYGSVNKNNPPLFIVDGAPYIGNINNLKQEDIKSIKVLKDASATSLYGSRAANGVVLISLKNDSESNINSVGNAISTGITNTRFKINKKYSIASDGDVSVIEIDKFNVPANYNYFAAPLLNENVFLTAKIGNWEQYNLLPAEANIYFEGSYSGKTNINPSATTDSLTISLGVDPNIIVKRTQLNNFKKTTFIGSNKVIYKGFEIEIKNNKQSDIELSLYDRIPISQNKDIKLDDIETGSSEYNDEKGILKWILKLKPGETEIVKHSYSVKFPKYKRVNL